MANELTVGVLNEKIEYAKQLAYSNLLPAQYRGNAPNLLWAIEYAQALNLPAISVVTGINVIEGKPSLSAGLMSALVRRAGHRLRISTGSDDNGLPTATAAIVRKDDPDHTFTCTWTCDRAVRAGLMEIREGKPYSRSQNGNPLPWEKYTEAMLKARTISEVCRDACEEVLHGAHYTPEELGVEVDNDGAPVDVTPPAPVETPTAAETSTEPEVAPLDIRWHRLAKIAASGMFGEEGTEERAIIKSKIAEAVARDQGAQEFNELDRYLDELEEEVRKRQAAIEAGRAKEPITDGEIEREGVANHDDEPVVEERSGAEAFVALSRARHEYLDLARKIRNADNDEDKLKERHKWVMVETDIDLITEKIRDLATVVGNQQDDRPAEPAQQTLGTPPVDEEEEDGLF